MKKIIYLPTNIANYFLSRAKQDGIKDMTPMKLIKLVYFSYAWNLAIFERKLFYENIEAWKYGPVVPSIYHEFKRFGNSTIERYAVNFEFENDEMCYPVINRNDKDTIGVVEAVWSAYKNYNGWELSQITHEPNSPWNIAYSIAENSPIDDFHIAKRAKEAILKHLNSSN
jgi:uncharacterized phage-associated protein